jgi:hypothetical protein
MTPSKEGIYMKFLIVTGLILGSVQLSFGKSLDLEVLEAQFNTNLAIMQAQVGLLEGINNRLSNIHQRIWLDNQNLAISNTRSRLNTTLLETELIIENINKSPGQGEQDTLRYIRLANESLNLLEEWSTRNESGLLEIKSAAFEFERFMKKAARKIEDYIILAEKNPDKHPLSKEMSDILAYYNESILRGRQVYLTLKSLDKAPRFWLPKDGKAIVKNLTFYQPNPSEQFQKVLTLSIESLINEELKYRGQSLRERVFSLSGNINNSMELKLFASLLVSFSEKDLEKLEVLNSISIKNLWQKMAYEIVLTDIKEKHIGDDLIKLAGSIQTEEQLKSFILVAKELL